MSIRNYEKSDLEKLVIIEKLSQRAPWSRESFESLLAQKHIFGKIWDDQGVQGFCIYSVVEFEFEILDIAVHPQHRKKGIAAKLLNSIFSAFPGKLTRGFLEVRPSNEAAIALYHSFGFKHFGRRVRYYSDNGEDALLMRWELSA